MFIKPAEGLLVRCPVTHQYLPEEGKEVENSLYWRRRLKDGDVVEATPHKAKKAPVKSDEKDA